MSTQLVIFDFDGTLFDTHASISHTIALTFAANKDAVPDPPSEAAIQRMISSGAGLEDTFAALHPSPSAFAAQKDAWIATYRDLYAAHGQPLIKAFPGAHALLAALNARGVPAAIVSNKGVAAVRTALANNGLEGVVPDALIVGDKTPGATRKPDVGSYQNVLVPALTENADRYGLKEPLSPARVLVVGDTAADVRFASNIGAKGVWCRYGYGDRDECERLKPAFVVDGLEQVLGLLKV